MIKRKSMIGISFAIYSRPGKSKRNHEPDEYRDILQPWSIELKVILNKFTLLY